MSAKPSSIKTLLRDCLTHLEGILHLSRDIVSAVEFDEFEKVEQLFEKRGEEIASLSKLEAKLELHAGTDPSEADSKELNNYKQNRNKLFSKIQALDKKVNKAIIMSKEKILAEIKELYRGRKMNKEYINSTLFVSGFIDVKE